MRILDDRLIVVRGAGDIATGTIHRLCGCGFRVLALERDNPAAIRRQVAFSEAIYDGTCTVEGITCRRADTPEEAIAMLRPGQPVLLADPEAQILKRLHPYALVDGILAKKNLGTSRLMAPRTIALGPGFYAGRDVDFVIETMRGHNLGRIITEGEALPNTGVPGNIGGFTKERVIYAPAQGTVKCVKQIGDTVTAGEVIAQIMPGDGSVPTPVRTQISGLLRGLIRDGYPVTAGFKMADVDPRESEYRNCFTISDKARCIAGSVLEAILRP